MTAEGRTRGAWEPHAATQNSGWEQLFQRLPSVIDGNKIQSKASIPKLLGKFYRVEFPNCLGPRDRV